MVLLESNKLVVSKCRQFIGKGYVCGDLFHFLVSDFCNKSVNNICGGIMRVMLAFDIHIYVISILVLCLNCPA
jgi:hypothetical protein